MPEGVRISEGNMIYMRSSMSEEEREKAYPIGRGMLEFLELDFSEQESRRCQAIAILEDEQKKKEVIEKFRGLMEKGELQTERVLFSRERKYVDVTDAESEAMKELAYLVYHCHDCMESHPYIDYSYIGTIDGIDPAIVIYELANFNKLQNDYLEAVRFCCDVDYRDELSSLSTLERYFIYELSSRSPFNFQQKSVSMTYVVIPDESEIPKDKTSLYYEVIDEVGNFDIEPKPITKETIEYTKALPVKGYFAYHASTIPEYAYLELMLMVESNVKIRKCKNCGRYFILKGNYGAMYCDRIPEGKSQNCQSIGAVNEYKRKVNQDPLLKEYSKAYKRLYARTKNGKMSMADFQEWSALAHQKRNNYLDRTLSEDEFSSWLRAVKETEG